MSESKIGKIGWIDLTVENGDLVKSFYEKVVGWKVHPVSMGEYDDYCMIPADESDPIAGICHAREGNKGLPSQWLLYIHVADLKASITECEKNGGKLIREARPLSGGLFAVIRDPAGAVCALFQETVDDLV